VTVVSGSNVIVTWVAPSNGGSPISKYTITFRQSDGITYTENTAICNGALTATITSLMCTISFTSFTEAPYNLAWGSSIYAKVKATNIMGDSQVSVAGNGALI
jgi:molybdopterin-binding protein